MFSVTTAELDAWLATFLYPFFRFAALMGSAPLLSHPTVPRRVRVALALALTVVVAPTIATSSTVAPFSAAGGLLIVQQIAIGLALGLVAQFAFAAVTLAGDLIGLQMGLSFASLVDPANSEQTPLVGAFLSVVLMLVFMSINGHLVVLAALVDTFDAFPISADGTRFPSWQRLAAAAGMIFSSGLSIAFPVLASLMLTSLALGVLTRTAPQLNLFAVGFPVTLGVGLLMLMLSLPYAMPSFIGLFDRAFLALPR